MPRSSRWLILVALAVPPAGASDLPQHASGKTKVKELTVGVSNTRDLRGVVDKIDKNGLTMVEVLEGGTEVKEHYIVPIDLLRNGKVLDRAGGSFAYRWKDIERGDTVLLDTKEDEEEKVVYCLKVNINRRPGAKLPESQKPKEDHHYAANRIYNELENGNDVSDEEIMKVFPPVKGEVYPNGKPVPDYPGGLPREWPAKLEAIRAKKAKEKELTAKPPEKEKK